MDNDLAFTEKLGKALKPTENIDKALIPSFKVRSP